MILLFHPEDLFGSLYFYEVTAEAEKVECKTIVFEMECKHLKLVFSRTY